jgi:hypothetical protein
MTSDDTNLRGEEIELERALQGLTPSAAVVDPLALAFEAGRRGAALRITTWKFASVAMLGLMLVSLYASSDRARLPINVVSTETIAERSPAPIDRSTYLAVREAVLERGVDALPAPAGSGLTATPVVGHGGL